MFSTSCKQTPKEVKSDTTETDSDTSKSTNSIKTEEQLVKNKNLIENSWYRGVIGDLPIWFYIKSIDGKYTNAVYGYNSSKGASITLNLGTINNNNLNYEFEDYTTHYKEFFNLKFDDGTLTGEWKNSKNKTLPITLKAVGSIPQNNQEFPKLSSSIISSKNSLH